MSPSDLFVRLVKRQMAQATRWRKEGTAGPNAVEAAPNATPQFLPYTAMLLGREDVDGGVPQMPPGLLVRLRLLSEVVPAISRSLIGIYLASRGLRRNPDRPRREITPDELAALEAQARAWGAPLVGYTRLPPEWVFAGRRVLDQNVIVIGREGEEDVKHEIEKGRNQVQRAIADLGRTAVRLAASLRRMGFAAQAGPALGGDAAYPPLAEAAGLGFIGRNGLLLTEEFGPRVRLAVVYCSVDNLPFHPPLDPDRPGGERFGWMADFCEQCGQCIRKCPPRAIATAPSIRENGAPVYLDTSKCYPYFEANFGCGVCVEVCPLSRTDVLRLRARNTSIATNRSDRSKEPT